MSRPQPVVTAGAVAGLVQTVAFVLGFLGYTAAETNLNAEATTIGAIIVGAVTIGAHLLAALHAKGKVTPLSSPVDAHGNPLVPAASPEPVGSVGSVGAVKVAVDVAPILEQLQALGEQVTKLAAAVHRPAPFAVTSSGAVQLQPLEEEPPAPAGTGPVEPTPAPA